MRLQLHPIVLAMLTGFALASPAEAFQAQPESNTAVGPAEIRDFTLPGTPPPVAEPEPEPMPPPVAEPVQEPAATPPPPVAAEPTPAPAEPAPARPTADRDEQRAPRSPAADLEQPIQARDVAPDAAAPAPAEAPAVSATPPAPATTEVAPAEAQEGTNWLWPLLGVLAAIGGGLAFVKLRGRREEDIPEPEPYSAPEPEAIPAPLAVAAAEPPPPPPAVAQANDVPGIVMRPWLELIFKPARATATDGGASVQYEAVIRNNGNAPARNVRLAARMFNSGQDIQAEVSQFFAMGVDAPDGAPLTILPRTEIALSSVVSMPREEVREIKVQGRILFVPTVAFNLLYEWGRDKVGQTCSAHVVGREPDPPAEKMAPFRLDLGPRVYRSVGQRPSALARTV